MAFGIIFAKRVHKRTNVVKDAMCKSNVSDEDGNALRSNLSLQKYINYTSRISLIPIFYVLYRRKFFDRASPYMLREIFLAGICILGLSLADYASNEFMWMRSIEIIKKYGSYTEEYYVDSKAYERMQGKYNTLKKEQAEKRESDFKKAEIEKLKSKTDKMYD